MAKNTFYARLVYVAYGFFILLGALWFLASLLGSKFFNYTAFAIVLAFGIQAYFKHRLTNLILGVLGLFFSIIMLLESLTLSASSATEASIDWFVIILITICVLSIGLSGILIFSYTKLAPKEDA